jgi:hypothetical protein
MGVEMRERLAILAVADKAEAGGRRHVTRNAADVAAAAAKGEIKRHVLSLATNRMRADEVGEYLRMRPE